MYDAFKENPASFRQKLHQIMCMGGKVSANDLWNNLLGKDKIAEPGVLETQFDRLHNRLNTLNLHLEHYVRQEDLAAAKRESPHIRHSTSQDGAARA